MIGNFMLFPALVLIFSGFLSLFLRGNVRAALLLGAPLFTLWMVWQISDGPQLSVPYLGYELTLVYGSKLGRLFATVFSLMAFMGALFALNQRSKLELGAAFTYAGAAIGVALCKDLLTLFVFWEVMAVASTLVLVSNGAAALKAALRYGLMHFLGGVILMAGIAGHVAQTGSISFEAMTLERWPEMLMLAGILINAAAVPLGAWLPDAYPQASWSGMVFLSAFTTKTSVFVLIVAFPGEQVFIWIGLFMVFHGIIWAILENDMRRILAYSIINQVGFMLTGIGIGSEVALNGAAAHAFTHIIYKALLLMSAGSVVYMTGKSRCSDLGGLFRTMPVTMVTGVIGALAISAFPFTSGFVSKSMVTQGAADAHLSGVWYLLVAASAGVFLHAGIKFPWFVFFQKDSGLRPSDPPMNMQVAMIIGAVLCIFIGVMPQSLYAILPFYVDYVPYTFSHVVSQLQLLLFSGLAFFLMLGLLKRTETITIDSDWLWRRLGLILANGTVRLVVRVAAPVRHAGVQAVQALLWGLNKTHNEKGPLGRPAQTGSIAFLMVLFLAIFIALRFYS